MNSKTTIALSATAIVLTLFVVLFERHLASTYESSRISPVLVSIDAEKLYRIRVESQMGDAWIEKKAGLWRIVRPFSDRADPERIKELIDLLEHLTIRETIGQGGEKIDKSELGFGDSQVKTIRLEFSDKTSYQLRLGAAAPIKGTVFMQLDGSKERRGTYLVNGNLHDYLDNFRIDLRDRQVSRIPAGEVLSYTLKTANGLVELGRDKKAPRWFVVRPLKARANDDIAYSVLEELLQLEAVDFIPRTSSAAAGAPGDQIDAQTAVFTIKPQSGKSFRVAIREQEDNTMLATVSGREEILKLDGDFVSRLPKNIDQMRYPYLADLDVAAVAKILIQSPEDPDIDLRSDGRNWHVMLRGRPHPAHLGRVKRLLQAMNEETVIEYRTGADSRAEAYGFERPLVKATISTSRVDADEYEAYQNAVKEAREAGKPWETIKKPKPEFGVHKIRFGRGSDAFLNANFEGEPFVYAIDPSFLRANFPTHPQEWRGLGLASFSLLHLQAIEIAERGAPLFRLFYNPNQNKWTGLFGEKRIDDFIDRRLAERLADHLGGLQAQDWLTTKGIGEAYRALSRSGTKVKITVQPPRRYGQTETPKAFDIVMSLAAAGITEEGKIAYYYGQFDGIPDVFVLSASDYDRIMAPVLRMNQNP